VKLLLDKEADVAVTDSHNDILLHVAAYKSHFETMKLLLDKEADVAVTDSNE
jgi:ankyrin repeat protein